MRVSYKIRNIERVTKKLRELEGGVLSSNVEVVQEATLMVYNAAVKSLQENTDGEKVTRYNPRREAFASKPGDAPNTDTGRAVKSIKFEFINKGQTGVVGTNLVYLAAFELSSKPSIRRPWLSIAFYRNEKQIRKLFRESLKAITKKVAK